MKKILLLPTMLFPYLVCLCLGYGFVGSFADGVAVVLAIVALITLILAFICNLIFIFATKNKTATELLKTAFLIKAIHIPT